MQPLTFGEIALRLSISLGAGALIGIERQWHHKNAGLKTNTLVAVGAAAFTMISATGFGPLSNPAQVAGGVVTGIGFIGAGVVMRRGGSVQGVNSAATLWATASVGMAMGVGQVPLGLGVLLATLIGQTLSRSVAAFVDHHSRPPDSPGNFQISIQYSRLEYEKVKELWSVFARHPEANVTRYSEASAEGRDEAIMEMCLTWPQSRVREIDALVSSASGLPGVRKAGWSQTTSSE